MRLLVSVASPGEASIALANGADVIDAKDPMAGALGAVSIDVVRQVHSVVSGRRLVTAALGDAADERSIEQDARTFAGAGAALVKVGFAGVATRGRVAALLRAAVRGAQHANSGVVAVAYADADVVSSLAADAIVEAAADSGAAGVLLDTADKSGPGLRALVGPAALGRWVAGAHQHGLLVALAGRLTADDLAFVADAGADIAGIRGAACEGGRIGHVSADKIRGLKAICAAGSGDLPETAGLLSIDPVTKY
jgi:uncharacterized protein (UPF0264 family)